MWRKLNKIFVGIFIFFGIAIWAGIFISADNDIITKPLPSPSVLNNYKIESYPIPQNAFFAGEKVPIHRFDIRERYDRELLSNTYFHSNTILLIKRSNRYFPIIEPILKKNNIPEDFKYLALIESGFQPRVVSPAGAAGIWQFLRSTGKEYGLEVNSYVDERYHVEKATEAACKFLQSGYDKFGSWTLAAASYNIGKSRIAKELNRQGSETYYNLLLPEETSRYVFRALALKKIMEKPFDYGFIIYKEDLYPPLQYEEISITTAIDDVISFAKEHNTTYYMLKEFNPWMRDTYITNNSGKEYVIKIPLTDSLDKQPDLVQIHNNNWVLHQ